MFAPTALQQRSSLAAGSAAVACRPRKCCAATLRRAAAAAAPPAEFHAGRSNSKWETGIPPEMGGHVMASGIVAPVSRSTGAGTGAKIPVDYHTAETDVSVQACWLFQAVNGPALVDILFVYFSINAKCGAIFSVFDPFCFGIESGCANLGHGIWV